MNPAPVCIQGNAPSYRPAIPAGRALLPGEAWVSFRRVGPSKLRVGDESIEYDHDNSSGESCHFDSGLQSQL